MNMPSQIMDLSGSWELSIGDNGNYIHSVQLPGSLQEQGFGEDISVDTQWTGQIVDKSWYTDEKYANYRKPDNIKVPFWLQPKKHYVGIAYYRRDFEIPQEWGGKRLFLNLELSHIQTRLFIDGNEIGFRNTLCVPHTYELDSKLKPGKHVMIIQVDNRLNVDVGPNSHSVSDHTQTNWNGIVGKIELGATCPVWIDDVRIYPDAVNRTARLKVKIGNITEMSGSGVLSVNSVITPVSWSVNGGEAEVVYPLDAEAPLWDEFNPMLHHLTLRLKSGMDIHEKAISFGLRNIGIQGTQFILNGRKIFLRGTLECCVFPLTGYPPTDEKEWTRILTIIKSYGFNHVRFHSWCPPEAAFLAGDKLGLYFQIECSSWANTTTGLGLGHSIDNWLYDEARAIIRAFGNHPSFLFMSYGNEPGGKYCEYLAKWVEHWKKEDPCRIHTGAAGWPAISENEYDNIPEPRIQGWGEGNKTQNKSRINLLPPATTADYSIFVEETPRPIVSHEIGQWCVYPDFTEIPKYTGLLEAKNFEIFRESLEKNHMGDLAQDFLKSSGKLQILCYREEIESALRTKGFGGFQILQVNDFPGQGTALVGWLNSFWESKGYTSPEEFRRFNNSTVILARMDRRTYNTRDTLRAEIEVAHFESQAMDSAQPYWKFVDEAGNAYASGNLPVQALPVDNGIQLGSVEIPLKNLPTPCKYRLVVGISGTSFENDWEVWVYPLKLRVKEASDVVMVSDMEALIEASKKRCKVLFLPHSTLFNNKASLGFSSIFWNTAWTRGLSPHTLGILCDPSNPIFDQFPTESHSNWQWWEIIQGASLINLDYLPAQMRPLIQVIDDWFTNRRLGLLFEVQLDQCQMIISGIDLTGSIACRHVARQLRRSMLHYMAGPSFRPQHAISIVDVEKMLGNTDTH